MSTFLEIELENKYFPPAFKYSDNKYTVVNLYRGDYIILVDDIYENKFVNSFMVTNYDTITHYKLRKENRHFDSLL